MSTVLALGDALALSALQDVLEPFGHVLVPTESSQDLFEALGQRTFDLVLCDLDRGTGDLVTKILASREGLRLVVVTSRPRAQASVKALEAGAHSLMKKPFEIGQVLRLLSESHP